MLGYLNETKETAFRSMTLFLLDSSHKTMAHFRRYEMKFTPEEYNSLIKEMKEKHFRHISQLIRSIIFEEMKKSEDKKN